MVWGVLLSSTVLKKETLRPLMGKQISSYQSGPNLALWVQLFWWCKFLGMGKILDLFRGGKFLFLTTADRRIEHYISTPCKGGSQQYKGQYNSFSCCYFRILLWILGLPNLIMGISYFLNSIWAYFQSASQQLGMEISQTYFPLCFVSLAILIE